MADRFVDVTLDRPRRLRFTVPALREVKRRAGLTLSQMFLSMGLLDFDAMGWLLWAAMRHEEPKVTEAGADTALQAWLDDGHDVEEFADLMQRVAIASGLMKEVPDPQTAPATEPTLGPGTPTGSS